jgi:hypothetical protein
MNTRVSCLSRVDHDTVENPSRTVFAPPYQRRRPRHSRDVKHGRVDRASVEEPVSSYRTRGELLFLSYTTLTTLSERQRASGALYVLTGFSVREMLPCLTPAEAPPLQPKVGYLPMAAGPTWARRSFLSFVGVE